MNGPQHYREAERLTRQALPISEPAAALVLATLAQAHATLALTAATAMQAAVDGSEPGMGSGEFHEWYEAAGVKPSNHDEMNNSDVFTYDELHEMDQADEARLDAEDDARTGDDDEADEQGGPR